LAAVVQADVKHATLVHGFEKQLIDDFND